MVWECAHIREVCFWNGMVMEKIVVVGALSHFHYYHLPFPSPFPRALSNVILWQGRLWWQCSHGMSESSKHFSVGAGPKCILHLQHHQSLFLTQGQLLDGLGQGKGR